MTRSHHLGIAALAGVLVLGAGACGFDFVEPETEETPADPRTNVHVDLFLTDSGSIRVARAAVLVKPGLNEEGRPRAITSGPPALFGTPLAEVAFAGDVRFFEGEWQLDLDSGPAAVPFELPEMSGVERPVTELLLPLPGRTSRKPVFVEADRPLELAISRAPDPLPLPSEEHWQLSLFAPGGHGGVVFLSVRSRIPARVVLPYDHLPAPGGHSMLATLVAQHASVGGEDEPYVVSAIVRSALHWEIQDTRPVP